MRWSGPQFEADRGLPIGSALLAGLLTAAAISSVLVLVPLGFTSWAGVLVAAIGYVAIAVGGCAAAFLISVLLRTRYASDDLSLITFRCATVAAWIPALTIFFVAGRSQGATAAIALLAVGITAVLRQPEAPIAGRVRPPGDLFSGIWVTDAGPSFRKLLCFIGAAALLESAAMLAVYGELWGPVVLAFAGAVALALTVPPPAALRWSSAAGRGAGTVACAVVLTLVALVPYVRRGGFGGAAPRETGSSSAARTEDSRGDRAASVTSVGPTWPGVILWTEEQRHTVLVPPLPRMSRALFDPNDSQPMSIPFFGAYWFFRRPHRQPPPTSVVVRGTPTEKGFRSTDRIPLLMQAHQNLGRLVDLTCCRAIELAISNADRWPGTVAIELVLLDSSRPDHPSLSLGRREVSSSPHWRPGESSAPIRETLTFDVPGNASLREFDEFVVLFHLGPIRADKSAKVAIDRFLLLPARG
jgi:hypothetical protein